MDPFEFLRHFETNSRFAVSEDGQSVSKQGLDAMWGLEQNQGLRFLGFRFKKSLARAGFSGWKSHKSVT